MKRILSVLAGHTGRCVGGLAFALTMVALPGHVLAALGGNVASVQADQGHMQASLRSIRAANYTVHELQSPTGIVIREYVSASGTVFGVAWQGPWVPDLHQLLGSYFEQYQQAVQTQSSGRAGRRPIRVTLPGLVVSVSGHPRSFAGHAYVPDMLPEGTNAEAIR